MIDYRALLLTYMKIVAHFEGVTFLEGLNSSYFFSEEEWKAIQEIEKEVANE